MSEPKYAEVKVSIGEGAREEFAFAQRNDFERRHDDERRAVVREQPLHRSRPFDEAVVHRLEQDEELGDVRQELRPEDPVGHLVEGLGREVHDLRAVRDDQPPKEPAREEVGHALGGVEEVECVSRGRGVHDDQVVGALRMDLEEALHRYVVVALDEAPRDVAVQRVGEDLVAGAGVRSLVLDEIVP